MAVDEATAAAATGFWVGQVTAAATSTTTAAADQAAALWANFAAWYEIAEVSQRAAQAALLSLTAQGQVAGAYAEYVAQVTAVLRDLRRVEVPRLPQIQVRGGVDLIRVHSRPAEVFRETYAFTENDQLALERAMARQMELIEADILLAARAAQDEAMTELKVDRYRRVLRPELSASGSCGLCIAASDRIYTVGDLLPIHERCKCITLPISGNLDPGRRLNEDDLQALYDAAGGSTRRGDLARVRYQVNEHGEFGPVLTVKGQKFTGPNDLRKPPPVEVARRQLAALEPVLASLERRAAAGENVSGPLGYQRKLIAKLRRVVADAA